MNLKNITLEQLDNKISKLNKLKHEVPPGNGWVNAIRTAINMSLRQLGNKLSITPQSVKEIEEREINGTISINGLKQVAHALDMKFVYGFIPNEKSLEQMIQKRAQKLAEEIVLRTSVNMSLEDQKNTDKRIQIAIKEKAEELMKTRPKYLWD